ncbi:MAG: hypothetical protein ACLTXL_12875 [Clostridia bacterium]
MRVVDVAVRQCYRFNCPNCGSRLEADCGDRWTSAERQAGSGARSAGRSGMFHGVP